MLQVETKEAGTGKWFPLVQYSIDDEVQRERAGVLADTLRHLGLYATVTPHRAAVLVPAQEDNK